MSEVTIGSSVYETMKKHDEEIDNHAERIGALEEADRQHDELIRQHAEKLKKLEDNALKLENTVMRESQETRSTMREQTKKLFDIVQQAMGYQTARTAQSHELRMAKLNMWSTVFLKVSGGIVGLLSSGGAIYYMLQYFFTK